jgi:PKD repeat protein
MSAQYYLTGIVRDSATLTGIPNRMVTITKKNSSYTRTVYTNTSGIFYDTLNLAYGTHKKFYATTMNCNQVAVTDSIVSFNPGILVLDICSSGFPLCQAKFNYYQSGNVFKKVFFVNKSSMTADIFTWTFGDGDSSNQINPDHFYSTAGAYQVCLTAIDTDINCISTICDTVLVFPSTACSNSFIYSGNSLSVSYQASVNNSFPTSYSWTFGDGTPVDTGKNVVHTYTHGGSFQTCLTTVSVNPWTSDTCIDNTCQMIVVSGPPTVNISGQVFLGTNAVDTGIVYLYKFHQGSGLYSLVDSVAIISVASMNISYYYFQSIPVGKYLTKVALNPSSNYFHDYAPSYYGNTIHWAAAVPFDLSNAIYDFPVNLSEITPINGIASIEGKVLEGTAKAPGDPIADIPIFLVNSSNQLVGYTHSNANGDYDFGDLAYDKYYLYADLINYAVFPSTTTPSEADKYKKGINIYISKGKVTGLVEEDMVINEARVFPNPTSDFINLEMNLKTEHILSVEIYNLLGNLVEEPIHKEFFFSGKQQRSINVEHLPNGVYSLVIKENDFKVKQVKVIIMR